MMLTFKLSTLLIFTIFQFVPRWIEPVFSPLSYVEVFQPAAERVVTRFPCTEQVRHEVSSWLNSITALSGQLKIEPPKDGLVVHVPLKPPLPFSFSGSRALVQDVYLMLPKVTGSDPLLLVFTVEGNTLLFHFQHDLQPFLKQHHILQFFRKNQPNK